MRRQLKRSVAIWFLSISVVSNLIIRLYPFATAKKFESISQVRLVEILRIISKPHSTGCELIRIGSQNDGGYVVVNDFSESDTLVSLGIGDNVDFERAISKKLKKILAFDHTVDFPTNEISNLIFTKLGVKAEVAQNFTTLNRIIADNSISGDLILKIDIEGWEWEVLDSLNSSELSRFKQIIGEFHGFHEIHNFDLIERVISKLAENFLVTNSHANNWGDYQIIQKIPMPDVVEISWLRKDQVKGNSNYGQKSFENLNSPNNVVELDFGYNLFQ
jgi:FkbM family methyltransferase